MFHNPGTDVQLVPVRCGSVRGSLLWSPDGNVSFKKDGDEALLTGGQFEILGGKGASKKWKHSIQLLDGSMSVGSWIENALAQQSGTSHSLLHTPGNCNETSGRPHSSCGSQQQGSSEGVDGDAGKAGDGGLAALQKEIAAKRVVKEQLLQEGSLAEVASVEGKLERLLRLEKDLTPFKWDKNGPPANLALLLHDKSKRSNNRRQCSVPSCPSSSSPPLRQQLFPHSPPPPCTPSHPPSNTNPASPAPCAHAPSHPIKADPSQQVFLRERDEPVQDQQQQHMAAPVRQAHLPASAALPNTHFFSSGEAKQAQVQFLQQRAAQLAANSSHGAVWSMEDDAVDAAEDPPPSPSFQTAPTAPPSLTAPIGPSFQTAPSVPPSQTAPSLAPMQRSWLQGDAVHVPLEVSYNADTPQAPSADLQAAGTAVLPAFHSGQSTQGDGRKTHPTAAKATTPLPETATTSPGTSIPSTEAFTLPAGVPIPAAEDASPSQGADGNKRGGGSSALHGMRKSGALLSKLFPRPWGLLGSRQHVWEQQQQQQQLPLQQHASQQNGTKQGREDVGGVGQHIPQQSKTKQGREHEGGVGQQQQQHRPRQDATKRGRKVEGEVGFGAQRSVRARVLEHQEEANAEGSEAAQGAGSLMRGAGSSGPKAVLHSDADAGGVVVAAGPGGSVSADVDGDVIAAGPVSSDPTVRAGPECARLLSLVSRLAVLLGQAQPGRELALRLSSALDSHAAKLAVVKQEGSGRWEPQACRAASYRRLEGIIRSSFYMARARQQQQQQQGKECGLVQLVSRTIDIDCWCSVGLPPPRPLPASHSTIAIARIAASALEQLVLQGCGSTTSLPDFDSLLKTCSQVVQAAGEEVALGGPAPSLLCRLLLRVYGSASADSGASIEDRTVQALVASVEPAHGLFRSMDELWSSN